MAKAYCGYHPQSLMFLSKCEQMRQRKSRPLAAFACLMHLINYSACRARRQRFCRLHDVVKTCRCPFERLSHVLCARLPNLLLLMHLCILLECLFCDLSESRALRATPEPAAPHASVYIA